LLIDERHTVLVADFHAQTTSCALVFIKDDHIVFLPPYYMSSKGCTVRTPDIKLKLSGPPRHTTPKA
jgi:hypothetical protein